MSDDREYVLWQILCTTCGFDGEKPVPAKDGLPTVDTCRCPKCSKRAYTIRPFRNRYIIAEITKELVRMKMDIMDLQGIAEGSRTMNSVDNPYFLVEGTDQRRSIEELKDHLASMVVLLAKSDSEKQLLLGRIEELEKACAEWAEVSQSNYQRAKAAEAKLAKAVEALGRIKRGDFSIMTPPAYVTNPLPSAQEIARTTLAELKGQNDG